MKSLKSSNYPHPAMEEGDSYPTVGIYGDAFQEFMGKHSAQAGDEIEATFKMKVCEFNPRDKCIRLELLESSNLLLVKESKGGKPLPSK